MTDLEIYDQDTEETEKDDDSLKHIVCCLEGTWRMCGKRGKDSSHVPTVNIDSVENACIVCKDIWCNSDHCPHAGWCPRHISDDIPL